MPALGATSYLVPRMIVLLRLVHKRLASVSE